MVFAGSMAGVDAVSIARDATVQRGAYCKGFDEHVASLLPALGREWGDDGAVSVGCGLRGAVISAVAGRRVVDRGAPSVGSATEMATIDAVTTGDGMLQIGASTEGFGGQLADLPPAVRGRCDGGARVMVLGCCVAAVSATAGGTSVDPGAFPVGFGQLVAGIDAATAGGKCAVEGEAHMDIVSRMASDSAGQTGICGNDGGPDMVCTEAMSVVAPAVASRIVAKIGDLLRGSAFWMADLRPALTSRFG